MRVSKIFSWGSTGKSLVVRIAVLYGLTRAARFSLWRTRYCLNCRPEKMHVSWLTDERKTSPFTEGKPISLSALKVAPIYELHRAFADPV